MIRKKSEHRYRIDITIALPILNLLDAKIVEKKGEGIQTNRSREIEELLKEYLNVRDGGITCISLEKDSHG